MNAKKKILSVALAASLAAVAVVSSSLAYFTDTDQKDNVFTVGNVDITLTEPNWDATGKEEAKDMYPGEAVAKDPTVTNVGANPAFVRVKVDMNSDVAANISFRYKHADGYNTADWVKIGDYYYYKYIVDGTTDELADYTQVTTPLFDQIVLSTAVTNDTYVGEQSIKVTAEAIQAQGAAVQWSRVETMTVAEIANWFENHVQIPYGE